MSSSETTSGSTSPISGFSPADVPDGQGADFDIETLTRQANMTIVVHPGSSHLRIGRASDTQPVMIPHVIAWRHKLPGNQQTSRMKLLRQHKNSNMEALKQLNKVLHQYSGKLTSTMDEVCKSNKRKKPEKLLEGCGWVWTETSHEPEYLIGDDALYIDESDCYDLFFPIVNGQLNISVKSLTAVLADLEALWTKAIENFLRIPIKEMKDYRCILVIPDIYIREHVKSLVDLLLVNIKFKSIIVHQESVCATYGCGTANACVVDVGHQKSSVSCVEDGFSHPNTRICMDIGGCDITSTFAWYLKLNFFPYRSCNINDRMDALLLEELKETFCHLDMGRIGPEPQEFNLRRPGQLSLLYPITLGDEALQAPMSLFFPKLFGIEDESSYVHLATTSQGDSNDPFDETYLALTRTKQEEAWASKREKAAASARGDEKSGSSGNGDEYFNHSRDFSATSQPSVTELIGLDEAIVWSIENCPISHEDELKRRMYSCILLVGGGLPNFSGVEAFIQKRVTSLIPSTSAHLAGQVRVVTKPQGQDPSIIAWRGGAVLSSLDNAQELWISRDDWIRHGLRLLRENCAFVW